jgi:hypothetical protein
MIGLIIQYATYGHINQELFIVTKISKFFSKKLLIIAAIPLLIMIYFFDNIKGQYRFMQYCKNEGGLRVYESVVRGVGWQAKDYYDARSAFQLEGVGFIRYIDTKGDKKTYDLRYMGGDRDSDSSYKKLTIDETKEINYVWTIEISTVPSEVRLNKTSYKVFDNSNNKLVAIYNRFIYSQFDQDNSLFSVPSYVSCFKEKGKTFSELNKIFVRNQ